MGPKFFSRKYFVGPKFVLVDILWFQNLFSRVFCVPNFFLVMANFVIQIF